MFSPQEKSPSAPGLNLERMGIMEFQAKRGRMVSEAEHIERAEPDCEFDGGSDDIYLEDDEGNHLYCCIFCFNKLRKGQALQDIYGATWKLAPEFSLPALSYSDF